MKSNSTSETVQPRDAQSVNAPELVQTVLLICVKYGCDAETARYLDSLRQLHGQRNLRVLVVDNTVGAELARAPMDSNFTFVRAEENLGYFGGVRSGLSLYLRNHPLPDWVIVSNVDLVIADLQFLNKLAALRAKPRLGAVAPSIRSALTGKDQNPFMRSRPSAVRMHAYKWMYQSWLVLNTHELASAVFHKIRLIGRRLTGAPGRNLGGKIYAPHGSFLILSREYFCAGGSLDFPCFLFGEEVYLAESIKMLGLDVVYDPSLEVVHQEHKSTKLLKSRKLAQAVASSAAYCADTYFPLK